MEKHNSNDKKSYDIWRLNSELGKMFLPLGEKSVFLQK